jgi:Transposase
LLKCLRGGAGIVECLVVHRRPPEVTGDPGAQVKNLPGGPKRDPSDSRWLAACFERGAVTPCFVATEEFRVIRLHTRYRRELTEERTQEKQRAEKLLNNFSYHYYLVTSTTTEGDPRFRERSA